MSTANRPKPQRRRQRVIGGDRSTVILGSDRRVPGGLSGRCKLCQHERTIELSHVVPRWAYQWHKAEGGIHGQNLSMGVLTEEQDGTKHYLLCRQCEQHLGSAEEYVAAISRGTSTDLARHGVSLTSGPALQGLNLDLVYRCIAGVLVKCHFSTTPPFRRVSLKRDTLHQLRRRIFEDDYDTPNLALIATKWVACAVPGMNPRAYVYAETKKLDGARVFGVMMGGIEWILIYSAPLLAGRGFCSKILRPGRSEMMFGDIAEHRHFDLALDGALNTERGTATPWTRFPGNEPCPCGLGGGTFAACCQFTWAAAAHTEYTRSDAPVMSHRAYRRQRERDDKRRRMLIEKLDT